MTVFICCKDYCRTNKNIFCAEYTVGLLYFSLVIFHMNELMTISRYIIIQTVTVDMFVHVSSLQEVVSSHPRSDE